VISIEKDRTPLHLVAPEEEFDEDAFDQEFEDEDDDEIHGPPGEEPFDEDPPLGDLDEALPVNEEIPGAGSADDEELDEEEGEQTGRFKV
jgi:hypothetical protein